jgi:hypothetical protein
MDPAKKVAIMVNGSWWLGNESSGCKKWGPKSSRRRGHGGKKGPAYQEPKGKGVGSRRIGEGNSKDKRYRLWQADCNCLRGWCMLPVVTVGSVRPQRGNKVVQYSLSCTCCLLLYSWTTICPLLLVLSRFMRWCFRWARCELQSHFQAK